MKIFNFGSLNIDRVYAVDHFVRPGETLTSSAYNEFAGGKGLNQSIALARAGAEVYHVGKIGPDGMFLKQLLLDTGVNVSLLRNSDGPTGHAIIQVNSGGENSILLYGGANREITSSEIQDALDNAGPGDWILLQNETSGVAEIILSAAQRGLNVMFNPAPMTPDVLDMPLDRLQWLIVNEIEGEMISGQKKQQKTIDTILAKFPAISLILTLGSKGVHFANATERLFVPAIKVTPVDTTGAGDTFVGYFLSQLVTGASIKECLTLSSKASALCVTRQGAAQSIPTPKELL